MKIKKRDKKKRSLLDRKGYKKYLYTYHCHIELLISIRIMCKLSQCEAADIIHIDRSQLVKYENEETSLSLIRYISICKAYDDYITEYHIELDERTEELKRKYGYFFVENMKY